MLVKVVIVERSGMVMPLIVERRVLVVVVVVETVMVGVVEREW